MLSIVVVAKGLWPVTERCLETLCDTVDHEIEIVYVDNGTPPGHDSLEKFMRWSTSRKGLRVQTIMYPPTKMMFMGKEILVGLPLPSCWNAGAALTATTGNTLLIINNDLVFKSTGWYSSVNAALSEEGVGIVGLYAMSWHNASFIQGSFLAMRRTTFQRVGLFNEWLEFTCEDVDFCFRAQKLGYRIKMLPELHDKVIHLDNTTRNSYPDNRTYFQYKAHESRLRFCYLYSELGSVDIHD